jgi:hypothetical protein
MLVTTEDADPQGRQRTARYVHALLDLNPDLSLRELAHAYAAVPDPDADVAALLTYLSCQTQRIDTAHRSEVV